VAANVVVRGGGSIGQRHARVFSAIGADVALWPVRPRPATHTPTPSSGPTIHTPTPSSDPVVHSLDDVTGPAALEQADLVVVATDTGRHVADALAALAAGARRVLVEKPVAPTAEEAAALAVHPRAADVWVAVPLRAHAAFRHLITVVGTLGGSLSAHVWCQSWLPDWRPDRDYRDSYSAQLHEGGVLRDLVHEIDYATVLFGQPALRGAYLDHDGPLEIEAEQAATLLWRTPTATVTCRLDYITRPPSRGVVVRGPRGGVEWNVATGEVRTTQSGGTTVTRTFTEDLDRDAVMAVQARAALEVTPDADAAQRHTAGAPATLAEGLAALELCDRAREIS
jgi:predicted dehydrogenase